MFFLGLEQVKRYRTFFRLFSAVLIVFYFLYFFASAMASAQYTATTTVSLSVCGDGIVATNEFCDDGSNTGAYGVSILERNCNPLCSAWGPYCGDGIVQVFYGEECDDGNNQVGDLCSPTCQNETEPVIEGGGGSGGSGGGGGRGSGSPGIPGASTEGSIPFLGRTDVNVYGRAYPGARITVLRDGEMERVVEADSSANFRITLSDQTPGITTLGFWALDQVGRRSVTYSATFQIVENAITTLSGILIPPTIQVVPERVPPNTSISFEGSALPSTEVHVHVNNNERQDTALTTTSGEWKLVYDTSNLTPETFHTVKANYIDPTNTALKSGFSLISSFYVGNRDVDSQITADLNFDGLVNLTDFSILLFNWNTTNPVADINKDGRVDLADFSIMLFYWTG